MDDAGESGGADETADVTASPIGGCEKSGATEVVGKDGVNDRESSAMRGDACMLAAWGFAARLFGMRRPFESGAARRSPKSIVSGMIGALPLFADG
jgi:hypothetical protein